MTISRTGACIGSARSMIQLSLFPLDPRPMCMGCKRNVPFLGQWSPANKGYLCRECTLKFPAPMHIFDYGYKGRDVTIKQGCNDRVALEYHVGMENALHRLKSGCPYTLAETDDLYLPCDQRDHEPRLDCKRCMKNYRDVLELSKYMSMTPAIAEHYQRMGGGQALRYRRMGTQADIALANRQISLPLCSRCGSGHNHSYGLKGGVDFDFHTHCQPCEDELSVEAFWNSRGIFENDDVEAIMDRIHRSHPELFEHGVLPDYWFKLALKEKEQA